ncbi:hypothetical protein ACJ41O_005780 [Fusarium nematophilum]
MRAISILSVLWFCRWGDACVTGFVHPRQLDARMSTRQINAQLPSRPGDWTLVAENLDTMQRADDAFNARDMTNFRHHPNSTMYYSGGVTMNREEHFTDVRLSLSMYSDVAPHNHNYHIQFGEGDWTVAMTVVLATHDGPVPSLSGGMKPPSMRPLGFDMMTIAQWKEGEITDEYLWTDVTTLYRQMGLLPTRPPDNPERLYLSPYSGTPLSTHPDANSTDINRKRMVEFNTAISNGLFTAESLHLSPHLTVYGVADQPLGLDGFFKFLRLWKTAFPDLALDNELVIAQGDWTATIDKISGTHEGPWSVPFYLSSTEVPATGKRLDLLHYTVCRWQDGHIVDMRWNIDWVGIMGVLGILG